MSEINLKSLQKLTALALDARDQAYCPYSNHPVGASVLTDDGRYFSGGNCEFANFDSTCAENTALAAMASAGGRRIRAIMTVGPSDKYLCTPCGRCRQRIVEFSDENTRIYAMRDDGTLGAVYSIDELLPDAFGPANMAVLGMGPKASKPKAVTKKNKKKK